MDIVYDRCAGLDVHQATVVCAIRAFDGSRTRQQTRTFGTSTSQLAELRTWLVSEKVAVVAMEATGVFWKPVWNVLEGQDWQLLLCNPQHLKRVPGRKTDVNDAEWLARLVQAGLLRGSFVPDRYLRDLRDLNREREQLNRERGRIVNRLHKVLQDCNIKLTTEVSDIMGVSGREMLEAIAAGDYDPDELANCARARMRKKIPALREVLRGFVTDHHRWMIRRYLAQYDAVTIEIDRFTGRIQDLSDSPPDRDDDTTAERPSDSAAPPDMAQAVALVDTIPGIDRTGAQRLLAEIGPDMSRFPTGRDLASWACVCPGSESSGGKVKSSKTRKGNRWLRAVLGQMAWAATRTKGSYFQAAFRRLRARRGTKRAIMAIAHKLLLTVHAVLRTRLAYVEKGAEWFDRLQPQKAVRSMEKRLNALGFDVVRRQEEAAM